MYIEKEMAYWLDRIDGLGKKRLQKLREVLGENTEDTAARLYEMNEAQVRELFAECFGENNKDERVIRSVLEAGRLDPAAEYTALIRQGVQFYTKEDEEYPPRLRTIPDPPEVLYVAGKLPSPVMPALAVIGARDASPYGREQAKRFAKELSEVGIQIISGMARGVDGIAGRAALPGSGGSFAVLGCGVDICYPPENRDLYDALKERGGLISEYHPGTLPKAGLFPARNRIISGLSDALLVTEARLRSGTLITTDAALEQGREIFAIPGRISDPFSMGCNELIRQGAQLAADPGQIIEFFYGIHGEVPEEEAALERARSDSIRKSMPREEGVLYELLDANESRHSEILLPALACELRRPVGAGEMKTLLMKLVLKGYAIEEGNGWYRRGK
ncbi:MAG: DNA-processing protein DprA [Lachnospiraceae bacterium]|nr:DNA-processing protein DprA [Lachnospiraceae bacterium]MBQ6364442.1 DNA-processing protein DprA [Lachnospiraceae bacterium]